MHLATVETVIFKLTIGVISNNESESPQRKAAAIPLGQTSVEEVWLLRVTPIRGKGDNLLFPDPPAK